MSPKKGSTKSILCVAERIDLGTVSRVADVLEHHVEDVIAYGNFRLGDYGMSRSHFRRIEGIVDVETSQAILSAGSILLLCWENRLPSADQIEILTNHGLPLVIVIEPGRRAYLQLPKRMTCMPIIIEVEVKKIVPYGMGQDEKNELIDLLIMLSSRDAMTFLAPEVPNTKVFQLFNQWDEVLQRIKMDINTIYDLDDRKFEELIAELLARDNFKVELTRASRDGGRDILAYSQGPLGAHLHLVECKRYAPQNKVSVGLVRSLYGVLAQQRATTATLITTSSFTKPAVEFASPISHHLTLRDSRYLQEWITQIKGDILH